MVLQGNHSIIRQRSQPKFPKFSYAYRSIAMNQLDYENQITVYENQITVIIQALSEAGYDPYAQLKGYLKTGNVTFITRRNNARKIIQTLDIEFIERYVREYFER